MKQEKLKSFHKYHFVERKNKGRKSDKNSSPRRLLPRNLNSNSAQAFHRTLALLKCYLLEAFSTILDCYWDDLCAWHCRWVWGAGPWGRWSCVVRGGSLGVQAAAPAAIPPLHLLFVHVGHTLSPRNPWRLTCSEAEHGLIIHAELLCYRSNLLCEDKGLGTSLPMSLSPRDLVIIKFEKRLTVRPYGSNNYAA